MQAARPHPPRRDAPGHFVEQFDGTASHQVVRVAVVKMQPGNSHQHRLAPVTRPLPGPAEPVHQRGQALFAGSGQAGDAVGFV